MIKNIDKNAQHIVDRIAGFIREQIKGAGCTTAVVGISGGVDSALTAALSKASGCQLILLQMPCGEADDLFTQRSEALTEALGVGDSVHTINILPIYQSYLENLPEAVSKDQINQGNLRARIRANLLYAYARMFNGLVIGTGNLAEDGVLGYFTKYGDGAVDISPIGDLYKSEVFDLARFIGVPESILEAAPSAGLWEGQTDEGELGFTYDDARRWHTGLKIPEEISEAISKMHTKNLHKMKMPPICSVRELL